MPHIFAAGDVVTGPTMITTAVGQGRRAAFMIDRYLQGAELDAERLRRGAPGRRQDRACSRGRTSTTGASRSSRSAAMSAAPTDFGETEAPMTEDEAFLGAARCLDCGVCSECHACVDVCPADCIDFDMREEEIEVEVGAVVLATGFKLFPADAKPQYGYGSYKNVITGMQMDRLLAPTRPYNAVLRPGDGKVPDNIAYIMCTGSRDDTVGNPLCSQICCMYSVKQNQLIMGALPLADVTVYYIDVRSVGKGYDEFYEQAKDMGANFVKGRVVGITEKDDGNLVAPLRGHRERRRARRGRARHGRARRRRAAQRRGRRASSRTAPWRSTTTSTSARPTKTSTPAAPTCPACSSPARPPGVKDIPDSILHAGAAVAQAAAHLEKRARTSPHEVEGEGDGMSGRKIGVYVCQCGGNIGDYVDVDEVVAAVEHDPDVVVARTAMFTCSDATQQEIIQDAHEQGLDALVVASCSPKLHTFTFRDVAKRAGMNPFQYTQVNVREQCSWTHTDDHEGATEKAVRLVRAGINRTRLTEPLEPIVVETTPKSLVVGGGIAGLRAALGLAEIGLSVFLVEKEAQLGGWVAGFGEMYPHGRNGAELIARLEEKVRAHPAITVFTNAELMGKSGSFGNYQATIAVQRRAARDDHRRRRLHRRRHRLRHLRAGGRRVRLRHRRRRHAARVQEDGRRVGRAA